MNDHPSLNIYFDSSAGMEAKKFTDDDICQVDMYVKSRLVTDVINLAKKKHGEIDEIDEFGSLTRIHPHDMNNLEEMTEETTVFNSILNLRQIFYEITPIKNKTQLSAQMFEKLMKKNVIKNSGLIQKVDLSLCF